MELKIDLPESWNQVLHFLETLRNNNQTAVARGPKEIAEAVGIPEQRVRLILAELYRMNLVERRTRGISKKGYPLRSFYRIKEEGKKI